MSHPHPELTLPPALAAGALRVVALGGLGEVGRNMAVLEHDGRLLVIDCGVLFPEDHQPGVDLILPDFEYIKDRLDGTLSYRWSCRMGVCGSCGMTVNGEPKLTCATFLAAYAPGPIRVEPLKNFPIIRDLVVDIGDFLRKLVTVKPWLVRDHGRSEPGRPNSMANASVSCMSVRLALPPARSWATGTSSSSAKMRRTCGRPSSPP